MKKYRFLDHTADIKVEAWGKNLEDVFKNAGIAFYDIVLDIQSVEKKVSRGIRIEGFDLKSLLFNWIDKLILLFELESLVFRDFDVDISQEPELYRLVAIGYGERYDREKHGYKVHVKAMTYHEMEIRMENEKYIVRFVVDI